MNQFTKVIHPGTVDVYKDRLASVFCKIEFESGKLSISGVIGPLHSGNALGGCGQIDMEFRHRNSEDNDERYSTPEEIVTFAPGWTEDLWFDFLDVWNRWHLNDMKPNCEHQVGPEWKPKKAEVVTYKLTMDAWKKQEALKKRALATLTLGNTVALSPVEQTMLSLKHSVNSPPPGTRQYYEVDKRETKQTSWVYQSEHPEGLLRKPCPVCGYEYGSAWKSESVPREVLQFLQDLPDTNREPAWI